eukprot:SAG31_NODE_277_length_18641_cov_21.357944_14_plen_73_part_00
MRQIVAKVVLKIRRLTFGAICWDDTSRCVEREKVRYRYAVPVFSYLLVHVYIGTCTVVPVETKPVETKFNTN